MINIIDTPGHVDFTAEVERSLRVLDGAVALLDSVAGVEPQTETVWRQADKYRVPRIVYANKLDRVGADFDRCVDMVRERLDTTPVVLQRPYFTDGEFRGVADLVEMELHVWGSDSVDSNFETGPIPDAFLEECELAREEMLDALSHFDDHLLELLLEDETVESDVVTAVIRKATLES